MSSLYPNASVPSPRNDAASELPARPRTARGLDVDQLAVAIEHLLAQTQKAAAGDEYDQRQVPGLRAAVSYLVGLTGYRLDEHLAALHAGDRLAPR